MSQKTKLILIIALFLVIPSLVGADYYGQTRTFLIEPSYDLTQRNNVTAVLEKITPQLYFYLDGNWWGSLNFEEQLERRKNLDSLAEEFETKIYPTLTATFGEEAKPGIDGDSHLTILIHPMIDEAGGYFRGADGYPAAQVPGSNEREMLYLNSRYLGTPFVKSFLSHELVHLITFNQKEKKYGIEEDVWLNEGRAEYAPTLIGYDDLYEGSNLRRRVKNFLEKPSDSITEWQSKSTDYGALNLFIQYLVDHYGLKILTDSLQLEKVGIPSLNEALKNNGFGENLSRVFIDWTVATFVNDCSLGEKYCYKNPNLKNFQITPSVNFLPMVGESTLSLQDQTKNWAGNWHKFVGGKGDLKLEFSGSSKANFQVPYLLQDPKGNYTLDFLRLNPEQKGEIFVLDFGKKIISLTIIPSLQDKISKFSSQEPTFSFSWKASTLASQETIKLLLAQIETLKSEIARVQTKINSLLAKKIGTCTFFENNLYYGMMNSYEVKCLQKFLKSQSPEIYPEGLVTGNFLSLTQVALIRFQEKYSDEILKPLNLEKGTGYVGQMTRAKINELLGKQPFDPVSYSIIME